MSSDDLPWDQTDPYVLRVRSGLRPAGAVVVGINCLTVLVFTVGAAGLFANGSAGSGLLMGVFAVFLAVMIALLVIRMFERRDIALITVNSITICDAWDSYLGEWNWPDIERIETTEQTVRGMRVSMTYHLRLVPIGRSRALQNSVRERRGWRVWVRGPSPDPASFTVHLYDRPAPRRISDFLYTVAPEQCEHLVPPRRRPKRYPYRDIEV